MRRTNEIDFYARKGTSAYYIQVSADISNAETRAGELRPFLAINSEIQKVIVINRPIKETHDVNGFTIIGAADFLLRFIKWCI